MTLQYFLAGIAGALMLGYVVSGVYAQNTTTSPTRTPTPAVTVPQNAPNTGRAL